MTLKKLETRLLPSKSVTKGS